MIHILIVERFTLVRSALGSLLAAEPGFSVIAEAGRGDEALALARARSPHVVVLDLLAPGLAGVESMGRFARVAPQTRIVALAAPASGPLPRSAMEAGASGYLTRACRAEDLIAAVHAAARGARFLDPSVAQGLALDELGAPRAPVDRLSPRELSVMQLVSQGHDRHTISDRLCLSPKTVSTYRTRLMRKLGASSDVELTHLSLRHGLIEPALG